MSESQSLRDAAADQHAEMIITQQPDYAATDQMTRAMVGEQQQGVFQATRIAYTILVLLEILLGIRFVLHLIGANPDNGFATFIYGITGVFVAPFNSLLGTPVPGGTTFEVTTLIAMAVYALLFWMIVRVIRIVAG